MDGTNVDPIEAANDDLFAADGADGMNSLVWVLIVNGVALNAELNGFADSGLVVLLVELVLNCVVVGLLANIVTCELRVGCE